MSDYVTDVVRVLASLPEKAVLVGHSMSGTITQKIIGEHPSLIKGAVLLAPAVKGRLSPEQVKKLQPYLQAKSKQAARGLSTDYTPYYTNAEVPVLVIGSDRDLLFPRGDLEKTAAAYGVSPVT